jgi:2'-5' RNA ligase
VARHRDGDARPKAAQRGEAERSQKVRAFFAVELGERARAAAADVARELRASPGGDAVRWVRPEGLHVTLRFLGDVATDRIPEIVERVRAETAPLGPFRLRLGGVHPFPSARRPQVVVLDVGPVEPLEELAEAVERGVVAAGFAPESRRFRAHLTLGRVRGRRFPSAPSAPTPDEAAWDVREAVLFRSELHRSGARYTALERIALGGLPDSLTPSTVPTED